MDFKYITTSLDEETLYNTKAPYILLYFYNPECEDCTKIKKELSKNKELKELIEKGVVEVLAILPDVDKEYWLDKKKFIPKTWKNCWIENDKLIIQNYLRTLPTFYVLDEEKYVFLSPNATDLINWIKQKHSENNNN
ncbi:MAG: thioredoxin fold domain-containing protein [Bacteroidales bacterium]